MSYDPPRDPPQMPVSPEEQLKLCKAAVNHSLVYDCARSYERNLVVVRALAEGKLRRDPDVKPYRAPRRAPVIVVPFEEREPVRVVNGHGGRASGRRDRAANLNPAEIADYVRRQMDTLVEAGRLQRRGVHPNSYFVT